MNDCCYDDHDVCSYLHAYAQGRLQGNGIAADVLSFPLVRKASIVEVAKVKDASRRSDRHVAIKFVS